MEHHDGIREREFVAESHTQLIKLMERVRGCITIQLACDFREVRGQLNSTGPTANHLIDGSRFSKCFQIGDILDHILLNLLATESIDYMLKE